MSTTAKCQMLLTPTNYIGMNSGRTRYLVECMTCKVVLHEATTGPLSHVRDHWRDMEEKAKAGRG